MTESVKNRESHAIVIHVFSPSEQIEIIQFVPILEDVPLHLAAVHPRHEILHVARDEESRIDDDFRTDANMALFDEFDGLVESPQLASRPPPYPCCIYT